MGRRQAEEKGSRKGKSEHAKGSRGGKSEHPKGRRGGKNALKEEGKARASTPKEGG